MQDFERSTLDSMNSYIRKLAQIEAVKLIKKMDIELYSDMQVSGVSSSKIRVIVPNEVTTQDQEGHTTISYEPIVAEVPKYVEVKDMVTKETMENVPNRTNEDIQIGDIVRMYYTPGTSQRQYIGLNFRKEDD